MVLDENRNNVIYTMESRPLEYVVVVEDAYAVTLLAHPVKVDDVGELYVTMKEETRNDNNERCELRLYLDLHRIDKVEGLPINIGFYSPDYCKEDCVITKI